MCGQTCSKNYDEAIYDSVSHSFTIEARQVGCATVKVAAMDQRKFLLGCGEPRKVPGKAEFMLNLSAKSSKFRDHNVPIFDNSTACFAAMKHEGNKNIVLGPVQIHLSNLTMEIANTIVVEDVSLKVPGDESAKPQELTANSSFEVLNTYAKHDLDEIFTSHDIAETFSCSCKPRVEWRVTPGGSAFYILLVCSSIAVILLMVACVLLCMKRSAPNSGYSYVGVQGDAFYEPISPGIEILPVTRESK